VLDWNTPAIEFYTAMGAEFLDTWRNVRMTGDALKRLAGTDRLGSTLGKKGQFAGHLASDSDEEPAL
jgi:hypothetical protein